MADAGISTIEQTEVFDLLSSFVDKSLVPYDQWTLHRESPAIHEELGDLREVGFSLEGFASVYAGGGEHIHAARLWGASQRLPEVTNSSLPHSYQGRYEQKVAAARIAF